MSGIIKDKEYYIYRIIWNLAAEPSMHKITKFARELPWLKKKIELRHDKRRNKDFYKFKKAKPLFMFIIIVVVEI